MPEVEAVIERQNNLERARYIRAGLVAATIVNVNRKKGARLVRPEDFIREPVREEDFMTPEQALAMMDGWAIAHNQSVESQTQ